MIFEHRTFDGRVFYKEATSLARAGYEVMLLVPGLPGGILGKRKDLRVDGAEPYVRDGVRVETYPYRRWIPRAFGLRFRMCRRDILARLRQLQPDLCHFHEDGVTMEAAAEVKSALPATRLVFDFHEFFLHRLRLTAEKRRRLARYMDTENRVLAAADGVITVSDFISAYYRTLTDKPVVTIMNCQSARLFPSGDGPLREDGTFWVVHEGRVPFDRGLKLLVEAARLVRAPQVRFLLVGSLPPEERAWFERQTALDGTAGRFHVTGMVPYLEVPGWLRRGQAGVCLIEAANGMTGVPNKFFNYLRFGIPVLTVEHPIMGPLVREADCGEVVPRVGSAAALAAAVDRLAGNPARAAAMSAAATRLFESQMNWERMEERLLGLYDSLLAGHAD